MADADPMEEFWQARSDMIKDCPECGSSHTTWTVPERGALGVHCEDCDWSLGPYENPA